jgi:asparagine N-glycosylation enzyme membrane subunit Stt3
MNTKELKESAIAVFKNKKLQYIATIIALLVIIFLATTARTKNINYLKDQTTGNWIPLDLDSYYFLRIAETLEANNGVLPAVDVMRYYTLNLSFAPEYLPRMLYNLHRAWQAFQPGVTMAYVDIWYPIIFFVMSLLVFFVLVYIITNSKFLAVLGTLLLAVIPPYIYPTLLGATDHDAFGIFAFLLMLTIYTASIKYLGRDFVNIKKWVLILLLVGFSFSASFVIAAWNGIAIYMFMIIPMSYLFIWINRSRNIENHMRYLFLFYPLSYLLIFLFVPIWGNFSTIIELNRYAFQAQGLLGPFTFAFILLDYLLILYLRADRKKIINVTDTVTVAVENPYSHKTILSKYRILISFLVIGIFGALFLQFILHRDFFMVFSQITGKMLNPFGSARIALTVSENQQPFFGTWITSFGKMLFWLAFLGICFIGAKMAGGISMIDDKSEAKKKEKEYQIGFVAAWVVLACAILFTRYSSTSMFNGTNLLSIAAFFGGFILFFVICFEVYFKSNVIKIDNITLLLASAIVIMLISGRGAVRLFLVISPIFVLSIIFLIKEMYGYARTSKEEISKILWWCSLIAVLILILGNSYAYYNGIKVQSSSMGPAANYMWQNSMKWVRENTNVTTTKLENWWDYGYFLQYLGQRPSLTDGGHGSGYYDWIIGRYVLTGNRPELTLSAMKSVNVTHLLIDPTDIGKYTAFSSIGSDTKRDRLAWIPTMVLQSNAIQETRNETVYVYAGGFTLDEDFEYKDNSSNNYYFPRDISGIGAVKITIDANGTVRQPTAILVYNNKQVEVPVRYLYADGRINDYFTGIPGILRLVPSVVSDTTPGSGGIRMDKLGALMYISPKVAKTLFANIYLMNDPNNLYPTIKIAHTEDDYVVSQLNAQGANTGSFIYYQGLRAPLQIYKIDYPDNILAVDEFRQARNEDLIMINQTEIDRIDNLVVTNG